MKNSNKTNGERVEEIVLWACHSQMPRDEWREHVEQKINILLNEALQAKDLQCQQEKIELLESMPVSICSAHQRPIISCSICLVMYDSSEDWKQNNLKRLKS